jgi:T-complex protein 1 subunit epsilon
VVILAGAFLHQAFLLLQKGVHPIAIIRGFTLSQNYALEYLQQIVQKFDPFSEEGKKILLEVCSSMMHNLLISFQTAKTSLNSKLVSFAAPHLARYV